MSELQLETDYLSGVIGRVAELHAHYYFKNWGFLSFFEAKVATELSKFVERYDEEKDRIFSIMVDERIEESISIDGSSETDNKAHLR